MVTELYAETKIARAKSQGRAVNSRRRALRHLQQAKSSVYYAPDSVLKRERSSNSVSGSPLASYLRASMTPVAQ